MDIISWLLARKYCDNSIKGISGVLSGKNCTIDSATKSGNLTTVIFKWTADDGTTRTTQIEVKDGETPAFSSVAITGGHRLTFTTQDPTQSVSFNVMDGAKGDTGISVVASNVDENNNLTLTLSNGNVINAGKIKAVTNVDNALSTTSSNPVENKVITNALNNKVDKEMGKGLFSDEEKAKLNNIEDGAQVNVLEKLIINGQEATITDKSIALTLITSAVSNLQNYYLKTETYTKQEVEDLIGSTVGVTIEIVEQLPTEGQSNVIYFLPTETEGVYSQYIYSNNSWILIGSTTVDLSNYYTKAQVDTLLNGKQNVLTIDSFPTALSNNPVASGGVYTAIAQMQPQFQFANMPTASSSNLGFVYQYTGATGTYTQNMFYRCVYDDVLGEYKWEEVIFHATVTVDSAISGTSTNPVQNKVIKEALDTKQDIMQYSTMPSAQDNLGKIVQYIGTNTANYTNGYFYKAVYNSESDVYLWTVIKFSADMLVDNALSTTSENPVQNKVITKKFDEYKTAFTGTEEEWDALTTEEQNVYDIMNITNDGDVLNLGVYLEKKTAMPVASEDVANKIYLYTGNTTQDYKKGVVYQCVSDGQDPATYSWVALIDFGTAALKNSTDRVSPNNTNLVESQSVYSAINTALSSIYTPRGDIACAELTSDLLIAANVGNIYETSDSGTTSALFLQGAGVSIPTGSNVGIINAGQGRILFNLMANAFDLTDYQKKDLASTIEGATTVEGALGALSDNKQAKTLTTSVESQTTVEGALGALSTNKATQAEVNDIVNVLGAKNHIRMPYYRSSGYVSSDLTYTYDSDGIITINGTKGSGVSFFDLVDSNKAPLDNLKVNVSYILSGGIGENEYLALIFYDDSDNALESVISRTSGVAFTVPSGATKHILYYRLSEAKTYTNQKLYPMIRLASDPDNTYVPYAMTNQQITPYVQAISNPNLLDNPWFTVNQRGANTYNTTGYTIDRWKLYAADTTKNVTVANGITFDSGFNCGFFEYLEDTIPATMLGKDVTLSVLLSNGSVVSSTFTFPNTTPSAAGQFGNKQISGQWYMRMYFTGTLWRFEIHTWGVVAPTSLSIRAAKLELGSVSTLAMDTAPNYATELLKCQRYFVNMGGIQVLFASSEQGTRAFSSPIRWPVDMRANPSINIYEEDSYAAIIQNVKTYNLTQFGSTFEFVSINTKGCYCIRKANVADTDMLGKQLAIIHLVASSDL